MLIFKSKRFDGKTILVLNKVDKLPRPKLAPLLEALGKAHDFAAIVPISAMKGEGCDDLLEEVIKLLPEGAAYFPEDQITDQPERFLASEIVREKAIALTYHEVPHALAVSGGQMGRDSEAAAHRDDADRGAGFSEKNSDRPQRRHVEEDWHSGAHRVGKKFSATRSSWACS